MPVLPHVTRLTLPVNVVTGFAGFLILETGAAEDSGAREKSITF
ncbi:MAG: hypothetical protein PVF75_04865 [Granulosicoccaceae bacterium]|jgi:hypothetical protein